MPRRDGTGPEGAGSMTGRKAGDCTGDIRTGRRQPGLGRAGKLRGKGWGFHGFPRDYRTVKPPQTDINRKALESEREVLHGQLEAIEQELSAIDAKKQGASTAGTKIENAA